MTEKGKFVVIEGADGTGKTHQVALLSNYANRIGIETFILDFPQYNRTFFGDLAGRFLRGEFGTLSEVHPMLASLPFAFDRWQASRTIQKEVENGKFVIANRYSGANKAHQAAKLPPEQRESFIDELERLEYQELKIYREDAVVVLHVMPEISQKLMLKKGERTYLKSGRRLDIHEEDLEYQRTTGEIYRLLVKKFPHWGEVECCTPDGILLRVEDISKKLISELTRLRVLPES